MIPKARSRLRPNSPFGGTEFLTKFRTLVIWWWRKWWQDRQSKLTQLLIGLAAYGLTYYLLQHFYPLEISQFFWPRSYVGLIGLIGLGHLYVGSFLTLRPRLALLLSLGLSWILWLKLHQFEVDWLLITVSLGLGFGLNFVAELMLGKKLKP